MASMDKHTRIGCGSVPINRIESTTLQETVQRCLINLHKSTMCKWLQSERKTVHYIQKQYATFRKCTPNHETVCCIQNAFRKPSVGSTGFSHFQGWGFKGHSQSVPLNSPLHVSYNGLPSHPASTCMFPCAQHCLGYIFHTAITLKWI